MTIKNRDARMALLNAPKGLRDIVDSMYEAASVAYTKRHNSHGTLGLNPYVASDDRAENLVTEMFLFVCASNNIDWRNYL